MSYDIEDLKRLVESQGWKSYCSEVESLIRAEMEQISLGDKLEDFQKIKYMVKAYKLAIELPGILIDRDSPA